MSLYYYLYMFLTKVMTNYTNISIAGNNEIDTTVISTLLSLSGYCPIRYDIKLCFRESKACVNRLS